MNSIFKSFVEAFEWFVRIVGLPELPAVLCQVRCQYLRVVGVEVAEEGQKSGSGVSGECVIEGGEVCVLKYREELITEGSVNITTFVVLLTLFGVLSE